MPNDPKTNVLPLVRTVKPLTCPKCRKVAQIQVDLIECHYTVVGVVAPGQSEVVIDLAGAKTVQTAIHGSFFRCTWCQYEWPVPAGTQFKDSENI